jgi:AcrR family transcriptional regulator
MSKRLRLSPDERREQIIDGAARLFSTRPYSQVTTTDIAQAAGVARGLLNHYFSDKRGLYLEVVRRAVLLPTLEEPPPAPPGPLAERVDLAVSWFLDSIGSQAATYLNVIETEGSADDIAPILQQAEDVAAQRVLQLLGLDGTDSHSLAIVRSYGGLAKATVYEWLRRETLTREQAHTLLRDVLLFMTENVLPTGGCGVG